MKDQSSSPILESLKKYKELSPAYFCVPGHRGAKGISQELLSFAGSDVFTLDLTETPITDDLHAPQSAIKEAQDLASKLWKSRQTRFLINGSSCGNIAMIMACASEGEKICIARNAHKSALSGLILSGASPVFITPKIEHSFGIHGSIRPKQVEEMFRNHPDCRGFLITSPTYYGVCSDLEKIAEICHKNNAILMVDEAHGAHLRFSGSNPKDAMQSGADICVQSTHKTCGALTQSSMLHINSSLIDQTHIDSVLRMIQSSSPSYLLMASLDAARKDMALNGEKYIKHTIGLADIARKSINAIPGLRCLDKDTVDSAEIFDIDRCKLVADVSALGISGFMCKEMLFEKYNIDVEMADDRNIVAVISFANTKDDIEKLTDGLADIARSIRTSASSVSISDIPVGLDIPSATRTAITPRKAFFSSKKRINTNQAKGHISAEMIAPYPPGIPVIYPGEIIESEMLDYLKHIKKIKGHVHGASDSTLETVLVIDK